MTEPTVTTDGVLQAVKSARLQGTVNPQSLPTRYWFEYHKQGANLFDPGRFDDFLKLALELEPLYALAPKEKTSPLTNLGIASGIPDAVLKNGAAMTDGLIDGGASVLLDGANDHVDLQWETWDNAAGNPYAATDASWWELATSGAEWLGTSVTRDTSWGMRADGTIGVGGTSIRVDGKRGTAATASLGFQTPAKTIACAPGQRVTASVFAKTLDKVESGSLGRGYRVLIRFTDGSNSVVEDVEVEYRDEEIDGARLVASGIAPVGTVYAKVWYRAVSAELNDTLSHLYTGMQIEVGAPSATPRTYGPTPAQIASGEAVQDPTTKSWGIGPFAKGADRTFVIVTRRKELDAEDVIFGGSSSGGAKAPYLYTQAANANLRFYDGSGSTYQLAAKGAEAEQTRMLAVTRKGAPTTELSVDAEAQGSKAATAWDYTGPFLIGANTAAGNAGFKGTVGPIFVYGRALT